MPNEGPKEHEARADMRMLYQVAVGNIEFAKRQQWRVTNYVLLLLAALITVDRAYLQPAGAPTLISVALLGSVIVACGIMVLEDLQRSLAEQRQFLKGAFEWMPDVKTLIESTGIEHADVGRLLRAVVMIGYGVFVWVLLRSAIT